jgi:hypothetical protein
MESVALTQMIDQTIQLIDKKLHCPEIGALVGQQGGVSASQLIVVNDGPPLQAQKFVSIDIVMGGPWAPMKNEYRRLL